MLKNFVFQRKNVLYVNISFIYLKRKKKLLARREQCKNQYFSKFILANTIIMFRMTHMTELTDRQAEILKYIIRYKEDHGMSPTIREIGDGTGITVKGASDHVQALIKKGYISTRDKLSRSIVVLKLPGSAAEEHRI
jgi:DNA-binding MarR family transcriptional regulator